MNDSKPANLGNASHIIETNKPIIKLALLRFEAIFDFYSEEPINIIVKKNRDSENSGFHQIFRIRRWISSDKAYSWCVYAKEREMDPSASHNQIADNIIIRYVKWDISLDQNNMKEALKIDREKYLNSWPSVQTTNVFLNSKFTEDLKKKLFVFDQLIENGFLLDSDLNRSCEWRDLEIRRHYDWGSIHNIWSPVKINGEVETGIIKIEEFLKQCIDDESEKIYSMELDFSVEPTVYKGIVDGT